MEVVHFLPYVTFAVVAAEPEDTEVGRDTLVAETPLAAEVARLKVWVAVAPRAGMPSARSYPICFAVDVQLAA